LALDLLHLPEKPGKGLQRIANRKAQLKARLCVCDFLTFLAESRLEKERE
jgi:hypothetical protein